MYAYMHTHCTKFALLCTHTPCVYIYIYIGMYACMHAWMDVCMYTCIYMHRLISHAHVHPSVHPSIHPPTHPASQPAIHPSIPSFIHSFFYLFDYLRVLVHSSVDLLFSVQNNRKGQIDESGMSGAVSQSIWETWTQNRTYTVGYLYSALASSNPHLPAPYALTCSRP